MDATDSARYRDIERTRQDYLAAARIYRAIVHRIERYAALTDDERVRNGAQAFSIVFGTCLGYIAAGADALEAAAGRMAAALAAGQGDAPCGDSSSDVLAPAPTADSAFEPASPTDSEPDPAATRRPINLTRASQEFAAAAQMLSGFTYLLNSEAAELHDRGLTGDPHPYGDVLYGICVPYLSMASQALAEAAGEGEG